MLAAEKIEARTPAEIISYVKGMSFCIYRGLLPRDVALRFAERAIKVYETPDHPLIASRSYSTAKLEALDADQTLEAIKRVMDTPFANVYSEVLGRNWLVSLDESPVFRVSGNPSRRSLYTHYHQDACVNRYPTSLVWIALTDCGERAAGLKLVCAKNPPKIPLFLDEHGNEEAKDEYIATHYPGLTCIPRFSAGDALFFNERSIHGSYVTDSMTEDRMSFKITGAPRKFRKAITEPIDPDNLRPMGDPEGGTLTRFVNRLKSYRFL